MAKIGKNKKACEKYRQSGRKALNKIAKKECAKKREEYFAKRREEGKTYTYKPIPFEEGTREYWKERHKRAAKNVDHRTEYQRIKSLTAKLDNEIKAREAERKAAEKKNRNKAEKVA